ncbi:MAG: hypothetical protein VX343_04050 [Thermodesulfobacteriota bacterium]|nr:hypothetical protein [Thermodesulfobacteriota bacterium]
MKIRINSRALKKIENSEVAPIVNKQAMDMVLKLAREAHMEMLQAFESHPVTKEIQSGPDGRNQSGTLGGYGNLYSFIGFEEGMDPVAPIRRILKKTLKVRAVPANHKSMIMNFLVEIPSKEELIAASPMPWGTGRSWIEGIEKGISGLGKYLNETSFNSRSGEGIQTKNQIRGGGFRNTKYLSEILNQLKTNLRRGIK